MHGVAIDEVLAEETVWGTSWALSDHLGTIHDWVDATTGTSTHYVYSAFGRILSIDGGDPSLDTHLFGFTGRETDADTGITDHWMYYRARYYNPSTGRFVSQDPIGFLAGDANLYRYVGNGVTGATDPSGQSIVGKTGKAMVKKSVMTTLKRKMAIQLHAKLVQIHHVIAQKLFKDTAYGPFLKDLGIHKNQFRNLITLPTRKGKDAGKGAERSVHDGCHLEEYFESIDKFILKVKDEVDAGRMSKWTQRKLYLRNKQEFGLA